MRGRNGDANLVKSFHCHLGKLKEFVSWFTDADLARLKLNQNTTHEEVSFPGAFALFALTASAQSTQAPAEKKAKTNKLARRTPTSHVQQGQGCRCCSKGASASTDAKGATCSKDKAAGCCSKGASASTDAKGATCSKDKAAGCCSAKAAAKSQEEKEVRQEGQQDFRSLRRQVSLPAVSLTTQKRKAQPAFPFFMPRKSEAWPVWGSLAIFARWATAQVWSHSSTG